jgi:hypothetical protein
MLPNIIADTADVWVDNVAPVPLFSDATPDVGLEGSDVIFTGSLYDPGVRDSWEYRWVFGDGTDSGWLPVRKIGGTGSVLLLHSWASERQTIIDDLTDQLGGFAEVIDEYDFGPVTGVSEAPELSLLLDYDVVYVSMNYYIFNLPLVTALGDVLADYADLGGGVVQGTFAAGTAYYSQLSGRWRTSSYNPLAYASNHYGQQTMGTIYEPDHMIMNGVSEITAYWKHNTFSVTPGATLVADYSGGIKLAAFTNEDHHVPGGGRIVGFNAFPWALSSFYFAGDGMQMLANSIMWASGEAFYLTMPIPLDPVAHIYVDDHPEHVTPSDDILAHLEVRDDDDGAVIPIGGLQQILAPEKFESSFPPVGWSVINNNPPHEPWRRNSYWGRTNYAGGDGYCADADSDAAYPWYQMDTELRAPSVDLSAFPSASLDFITSYNFLGGSEFADVDVSTDGGATWTNILHWTSDHSALGPGEAVSLDLSAFAGNSDVRRSLRL